MVPILSYIGCFVSLLLSVFLFTTPAQSRSNRLLGMFMMLTGIEISAWFTDAWLVQVPSLLMLRITSTLLQSPLLYLYVLSVCRSDFKWRNVYAFHALPFGVFTCVLTPVFYVKSGVEQLIFLQQYPGSLIGKGIIITGHLQFVAYFIIIFAILGRYRVLLLENKSAGSLDTWRWLTQLSVLLCAAHGVIIVRDSMPSSLGSEVSRYMTILVSCNILIVLSWFILKALRHSELFKGLPADLYTAAELLEKEPKDFKVHPNKFTAAVLSAGAGQKTQSDGNPQWDQADIALREQLERYLEQEKPFLEPDLTIQQLADALIVPVKELSLLINHRMNTHFFDLINAYRIHYAMGLLSDVSKKRMTIQEIMYESGFSSKSSFHTSFRKHATLTPVQYRKSALGDSEVV